MSRPVPVSPALALALALSGCPSNVHDDFPKSVGFQPLDFCATATPADWPTDPLDPCPETLNFVAVANCGGFLNPDKWVVADQAHARGYLKASLLAVWSKMQPTHDGPPNWVRLCQKGGVDDAWTIPGSQCVDWWHWYPGTEGADFPVSFRIRYHVNDVIAVEWDHTWREGALEGTVAAPLAVGARWQKTWGIENLRVESTSYVLKPAPDDTCTSIEMVGYLDADTQDQNDVAGTLRNAYNLLDLGVHTP